MAQHLLNIYTTEHQHIASTHKPRATNPEKIKVVGMWNEGLRGMEWAYLLAGDSLQWG
jgi:hypothetical protein